jgi:serine/threonine protein phosphatase PrpC
VAVDVTGECLAFTVADGVGTLEASPVASAAAVAAAVQWVRQRRAVDADDMPDLLASVNEAVGESLRVRGEAGATTLACVILSDGRAIIVTVGDSEVLAVGSAGPAERLNELDHVPARPNMLLAWIDGKETLEPHVIELECLPHRLCLVTDGIVQALDYDRIARLVREREPTEAARALVLAARDRGASDDITALVLSAEVAKSRR